MATDVGATLKYAPSPLIPRVIHHSKGSQTLGIDVVVFSFLLIGEDGMNDYM